MTSQTITADAAGTWTLGDLTVNRLGLGAMRLTGSAAFDLGTPSDRERSLAVLRRAVELGVNHIDTAAFYFSPLRSANELINSALAPYGDDLVITTKVGPHRDPSGEWWWARPDQLRGQVEENLRQLGRDHLDVVNLRIRGRDSEQEFADCFGALAELRAAGMIRHLGISNVQPHRLPAAQAIAPVVCVQNRYGIGASAEEAAFLRECGEAGVAYVPFFAIAGTGRERRGPCRGRGGHSDRPRARRVPGAGAAGVDAAAGPARAGHPRHRKPGPSGGQRGGGLPVADGHGDGPPRRPLDRRQAARCEAFLDGRAALPPDDPGPLARLLADGLDEFGAAVHHRAGKFRALRAKELTSKYLDLEHGPRFVFGHGLSYTTFEVGDPQLSRSRISAHALRKGDTVQVAVPVHNTGKRAGDEVVQVYLHDPVASVVQPVRRLRGFKRVTLKAGESTTVRIQLSGDDLGFWTNDRDGKFVVEPGTVEIYAGTSSAAKPKQTLTIT